MSKKKRAKSNGAAPQSEAPPSESTAERFLPAEFPPARTIALIGTAMVLLCILLMLLGSFNGLQGVKRVSLGLLGVISPSLTADPASSWNLAIVLTGLVLMIGASMIHPSLGLAALLLLRPWDDGYTFPGDNAYYLWGILFLFVLWGVRQLMRGERLRGGIPALLLLGFLAVAVLTSATSIEFAKTYKSLILWFGYFFLFLVTVNSLRDRKTMHLVMGAFALVLFAEAIYAILQYEYLLPFLRRELLTDREMRIKYFGVDEFSPELIRRFNVNRAFGSMLFPNALAAFLILGIPATAALAVAAWRRVRPAWRLPAEKPQDWMARRYTAIAAGFAAWFVATVSCFGVLLYPSYFLEQPLSYLLTPMPLGFIASFLGLAPGAAVFVITGQRGPRLCFDAVLAFLYTLFVPVQVLALYLSYSRGGMLALIVACALGLMLYRFGGGPANGLLRKLPHFATGLALVLFAAATTCVTLFATTHQGNLYAQEAAAPAQADASVPAPAAAAEESAPAPEGPGADASSQLVEQGYEVTMSDLANPATLMIRLTYWRVALRMAADYLWTGVGLGNFEWAYAKYQYIGAGPVHEAHNGYLQALCETGVFGALFLTAFWGWFALWGALRILREEETDERLLLAGLYAGVLAFAAHAFIDINFSHPSLMMFAITVCGLFYARAHWTKPGSGGGVRHRLALQLIALPMLVAAPVVFGMSLRTYFQDLSISRASFINVASDDQRDLCYSMFQFFMGDLSATNPDGTPKQHLAYVSSARLLIPDLDELAQMGVIMELLENGGFRVIKPGEPVPAAAILRVTKPELAFDAAKRGAEAWTANLEAIDSRFPHDADLAYHLTGWYRVLAAKTTGAERQAYLAKLVRWAETGLERNPLNPDQNYNLASALWSRGSAEEGPDKAAIYERALDLFETSSSLNPTMPFFYDEFAFYAQRLAEAYANAGQGDKAAATQARVQAARETAARIRQERLDAGLDPEGRT